MDLALLVLLLLSHMLPSFMESKFLYLSPSKFGLNLTAYEEVGPIHLSTFFAITYGFGFASIPATISHVALFYGK